MKKFLHLNFVTVMGIFFAICLAGYTFMVKSIMPKYIKEAIPMAEMMAKDYINGSVKIGNLTWNGGLTVEVDNIVIKDLKDKNIAIVPKTRLYLRPWLALIKPERALSEIDIERPEVWLRLQEDNKWNMTSLMKPSQSEETPFYGLVNIAEGKLNVDTPYGKWNFGINGSVDGGANPKFDISAGVKSQTEELKVKGLMTTKGIGKIQVNTEKLGFKNYAPLVKHYTDISNFAGDLLNTHVIWENDGKEATVSGETEFANVSGKLNINKEEHSFNVGGKLKAAKSILDLQKLHAIIDENQELELWGKADVHDLDNIGGQGVLTSPKLSYGAYVVEKLHLPFTLSKKLVQIDKASTLYGGGAVKASATVDLREDTLTADIVVNNVSHPLSIKNGDIIHANGTVAVLGRREEKEGRKTVQLHAAADTLDLRWQDLLINKMAFDGDFDGKKLTIDHFSAYTGDGVLALKGNVVPEENGPMALEGRIADFAIDPVLNHFTNIQGKGKLSMGFKASGTTSSPEFGTVVQLRDIDVMNLKMKEMHGFVGMKNKILTIKRMGATLTQGRHFIDGTVDFNGAEPVLGLDVESKKVRVEPLVAVATQDFSLTGNLDNIMHISGTPAHPKVEGELSLTDGSVQTYLLNGISGKYLYNDGFVSLKDFIVSLFVAQVKFSGTMSKDKVLDFDIAAHNVNVARSPYKDPNFDIDGLLNLDGHISGTLAKPYFNGSLNSDSLKLNGERYTDIAGSVGSDMQAENKFDISFKQPHQNAKGESKLGVGEFKAYGNLNIPQKFLQGKVTIKNGDINGLLRTDKLDYALEGSVDGVVDICPDGLGSGIIFRLDSKDLNTHNLHYDKLAVRGTFKKYVLDLQQALLQEKKNVTDKGYILASGIVDFNKKNLDMHAKAVEANPAIVNVAMKDPVDIKGLMNLAVDMGGSFDLPKGEARLDIVNGSVMGAEFDRTSAVLSLADDKLQVKELSAVKDVYSIKGGGLIPLDALRAKESRKNPNAEMDLSVDLDNTSLGILTAVKHVDWATGSMEGKLRVSGTLESPSINGNVNIEDGTIKLHSMNPVFEHVKLAADFNGEKAELKNLSMQLGKKGSITADGYYYLNSVEDDAYNMHIVTKDAELSYSSMFKGKINSELNITPQTYRDYWRIPKPQAQNSKATKTDKNVSKFVKTAKAPIYLGPRMRNKKTRPLVKGNIRLDDVVANILSLGDNEVGSETNIGLDLKIDLGPKIHMQNAMFYDIWLSGGLALKGGYYSQTSKDENEDEKVINHHNNGPDGLKIDGKIIADKGSITYLRTVFKITRGELNWTKPGDIMPYVKLDSWSRFGKYRIYINIDGSLGDIKNDDIMKLTSSPPLEKNTLVRMLTLQRESASGGNDISNDDLNNVMSAGLQMAVLGNVELWVKQTLGLDQFRVYTGKVNSGIAFDGSENKKELTQDEKNRYNVLISKYLNNNFMIGYTTSFNNDENIIFGQYDLGRHFSLSYSEKQKLSGERKHWAGVEYRIDFK